jgi:hypothetical protein
MSSVRRALARSINSRPNSNSAINFQAQQTVASLLADDIAIQDELVRLANDTSELQAALTKNRQDSAPLAAKILQAQHQYDAQKNLTF